MSTESPLHACLPQTLTVEELAAWITENRAEVYNHTENIPLDAETTQALEHKSSMASRRIDELKEVEKMFKAYLQEGTDIDHNAELAENEEPKHLPQTITIPPTRGIKLLTKNREWADKQLRTGYREEITPFYRIPFPEENMLIAVDIEGREREEYSREMTEEESEKYAMPILSEIAETTTLFPEGKKEKKKKKKEEPEEELPGEDESFI